MELTEKACEIEKANSRKSLPSCVDDWENFYPDVNSIDVGCVAETKDFNVLSDKSWHNLRFDDGVRTPC